MVVHLYLFDCEHEVSSWLIGLGPHRAVMPWNLLLYTYVFDTDDVNLS